MSYEPMTVETEAKNFILKVQKEQKCRSQSDAILLLKVIYDERKK